MFILSVCLNKFKQIKKCTEKIKKTKLNYIRFLRLLAFFWVKLSRGLLKSHDFGLSGIDGLATILLLDLKPKSYIKLANLIFFN